MLSYINLPKEIKWYIMSYLSYRDIINDSYTCKINYQINYDTYFWRNRAYDDFNFPKRLFENVKIIASHRYIQLFKYFQDVFMRDGSLKNKNNILGAYEGAIYAAGLIGDLRLIDYLVSMGMDIDGAIYGAIESNHKEIYEYLIIYRKNTNNLFYISTMKPYPKVLKVLLYYNIINPSLSEIDLGSALIRASYFGYYDVVDFISQHVHNRYILRRNDVLEAIKFSSDMKHHNIIACLNQIQCN